MYSEFDFLNEECLEHPFDTRPFSKPSLSYRNFREIQKLNKRMTVQKVSTAS
jgi:hypothetical protein